VAILGVLPLLLILLGLGVKVVKQYEQGVLFRFGRLPHDR
jgi:regulator of protease activity HflC (stomatin/prohibitin superfamily)